MFFSLLSIVHCASGMELVHEIHGLAKDIKHDLKVGAHEIKEDLGHAADVISPTLGAAIHGPQAAILFNQHKNDVAQVKFGIGISDGEREYLEKRMPLVREALERLFNCPSAFAGKYIPKIAVIGSGGGYRAMECLTGSLCGAKKIGLVDVLTYITALSGGTWALAPWISTGKSLEAFKTYIAECAAKSFHDMTHEERGLLADMIAVKKTYGQSIDMGDYYGGLLCNRLLACEGDLRHRIYLSDQAKRMNNASLPYPIYAAIDGRDCVAESNPAWYEYTPHHIGSHDYGTYIPSWAYGLTFDENGKSTNHAPEQPLGRHMGTWGSAFAADMHGIYEQLKKNVDCSFIKSKVFEELAIKPFADKRLLPFWAKIPNPTHHMKDYPLHDLKNLKFVDAGLSFNLPYPAVSGICPERKADVMIFLDASAGQVGHELKKVEKYARAKNLLFPVIDYTDIDKKTMSIFKDIHNPDVPVVIYMPRITDQALWDANKHKPEFAGFSLSGFNLDESTKNGFCETQDFSYTSEQSKEVMDTTEFNMIINGDAIMKEIAWVIGAKSK